MLAGVLVDVSASMQNSLQLHVESTDQNVTRAQSIFNTLMNIVNREIGSRDDQEVFVLAFGLNLRDITTCDLLALLDYVQTLDINTDVNTNVNSHEHLIGLLACNGAPYAGQYVREYLTKREAQFLFKFYSENNDDLRNVVQKLPIKCKHASTITEFGLTMMDIGASWGVCQNRRVVEERATKEQVRLAIEHGKDVIRQRPLKRLKMMTRPQIKTFQSTVNLLKQITATLSSPTSSSRTEQPFTSVQLSTLVDSIEPYIYGNTPMCEALRSTLDTFRSSAHQQKILFLLSDGESTDGNPVEFAQQLHDNNVIVFACLLTSNNISHPRRLYYEPDTNWTEAQRHMFELSSTVENTYSAMSILLEQNWELPASGHSRLFIQANHPDVIKEFANLIQYITESNDVLLNIIGRVSLDIYINAANSTFVPQEQTGATCYAHAVASVFHLAMRRIEGRENGVPDFTDICQKLIDEYGKCGATTEYVLNIWAPKYRLHSMKVDEFGARQAINQRRPVVATFVLDDKKWEAFSMFYRNQPQGILESRDLSVASVGNKLVRHAVVLIKCEPTSLTLMNSWGSSFADGGFFRVRNQAVLNLTFYDVYWNVDDLKESEIKAYQAKSSQVGQTMIQKLPASIKNLPYKCPQCHQCSAAIAFITHFLEAECPKCHQHFKPTPLGFVLN
jgi:hypothetical protein